MALATLNYLSACVRNSFPMNTVSDDLGLNHFSACIKVKSTNHIGFVTARYHCCALSWCRHPSCVLHILDTDSETLSLLHPLYVSLQSSDQFFNQSIFWKIFSRRSSELFLTIPITRLGVLVDDSWFWTLILNPCSDKLRFGVFMYKFACIRAHLEVR